MTLQDLKDYRRLKTEVADLRKRAHHQQQISDVVTGSSPEPPYTAHSIKITGCDYNCSTKLYNTYIRKAKLLEQKIQEIEDYISTIDDSLVRLIIRFKFIDTLGWRGVAQKIGGGHTADSIRMVFVRFVKHSMLK